jgi:hypothetical protein
MAWARPRCTNKQSGLSRCRLLRAEACLPPSPSQWALRRFFDPDVNRSVEPDATKMGRILTRYNNRGAGRRSRDAFWLEFIVMDENFGREGCRSQKGQKMLQRQLPVMDTSRTVIGVDSREQGMEATPGIEPGFADLQSAASPLRHVASREWEKYPTSGWRL